MSVFTACLRSFSRQFQKSALSTYNSKIGILNKAFTDEMPVKIRDKFQAQVAEKKLSPSGSTLLALSVLNELPVNELCIPLHEGHLGHLEDESTWKQRHDQVISEPQLPGISDRYHTVTASKVASFIEIYTKYSSAFNFVEIGCLTARDAPLIVKCLNEKKIGVSSYVGMDLSKSGLIAAACFHKHAPWVKRFNVVHGNAEVFDNFQMLALSEIALEEKFIFCNKLISAVPPIAGNKILANIASYMKPRDYALINFTISSPSTQAIVDRIQGNPDSMFKLEKHSQALSVYKKPDIHLQQIFDSKVLKEMLNRIGLAPIAAEVINESQQSKSSNISAQYAYDEYDRELLLLVVKEENLNSLE